MISSRIALGFSAALLASSALATASFAADADSKAPAKPAAKMAIPPYVAAALHDGDRLPADLARDKEQPTAEILAFSGIKPGDKVAEIVPTEYYARLISKVVGPKGKYYGVIPLSDGVRDGETLRAKLEDEAKKSGKPVQLLPIDTLNAITNIADYSNVQPLWEIFWQYGGQFSVPEPLDAVFTFNIYHDLHIPKDYGIASLMPMVDKRIFAEMKPGGTFTIVDNRSAPGAAFTVAPTLHRSDPEAVKAEMLSAGFVLDGESNIAALSTDDHTQTAQGAAAWSRVDHYMYRFKKPLNAKSDDRRPTHDVLTGFYGNTTISGDPGTPQRHVFYHPDHTYQEFGWNDMQSGTWYWDAAGHNCMLHQWPAVQRNFVVCHDTARDKHVGDKWTQDNGQPFQGNAHPYIAVAGYVYPEPKQPAAPVRANNATQ